MIVGFVGQVGFVVDGDVLHVAIVAQGHGKKVAKFQIELCPVKMRQQRLALAARRAAPAPAPAPRSIPLPEPVIDERIARVTGLRLPAGKFEMFVFTNYLEMSL
ncbi:MAG: hypothetical protein IT338_17700 [Thermomicrobiales bacterium]|nr:hypothetical protein [Thermomicrobiales bacterium]